MIIFIVLINSDIDVLFSISNIRPGVLVSFFSKSTRNFILEKFSKFRELMEWFSVILISSAFSSVPELDSRRRIPLASSWHNDSLTKVSRKRFQNHRKLIQTHPFKDDSSSKSVIFVHKSSKLAILTQNSLIQNFWVEILSIFQIELNS